MTFPVLITKYIMHVLTTFSKQNKNIVDVMSTEVNDIETRRTSGLVSHYTILLKHVKSSKMIECKKMEYYVQLTLVFDKDLLIMFGEMDH